MAGSKFSASGQSHISLALHKAVQLMKFQSVSTILLLKTCFKHLMQGS